MLSISTLGKLSVPRFMKDLRDVGETEGVREGIKFPKIVHDSRRPDQLFTNTDSGTLQ